MRGWVGVVLGLVAAGCRPAATELEAGQEVRCEVAAPVFPAGVPVLVRDVAHAVPHGLLTETTLWNVPPDGGQLTPRPLGLRAAISGASGDEAIVSDRRMVRLLAADGGSFECARAPDELSAVALSPAHAWWATAGGELWRSERADGGCAPATRFAQATGRVNALALVNANPVGLRERDAGPELVAWAADGAETRSIATTADRLCAVGAELLLISADGISRPGGLNVTSFNAPLLAAACLDDGVAVALGTPASATLERNDGQGTLVERRALSGQVHALGAHWVVVDGVLRAWDGALLEGGAQHVREAWAMGAQVLVSQFPAGSCAGTGRGGRCRAAPTKAPCTSKFQTAAAASSSSSIRLPACSSVQVQRWSPPGPTGPGRARRRPGSGSPTPAATRWWSRWCWARSRGSWCDTRAGGTSSSRRARRS